MLAFFIRSYIQDAGIEGVMLDNDKLWVVLAVVLFIWLAFIVLIFLIDRQIDKLESNVEQLLDMEHSSE